jgi:hydrogenase expression/formation protein HypC
MIDRRTEPWQAPEDSCQPTGNGFCDYEDDDGNLLNLHSGPQPMCLGIPGEVVEIVDASTQLAKVDIAGVRRPVNLACVVDDEHPISDCVGDWVLVHVGFAMSRIDADEARKTLALLSELGEAQAEVEAMQESEALSAADTGSTAAR